MTIDDPLEKSAIAADIREESERSLQEILIKSGVAGALSRLPCGIGSAINEMMTQLAFRRAHERMQAMFDEMAEHIKNLGEEKIDREWFRGEEFQSLLFEAFHQLHVMHDKEKISMLGKALANSGATEFRDESRKQIFFQLIRELTPQHVSMLRKLMPRSEPSPGVSSEAHEDWSWRNRQHIAPTAKNVLVLQMLAANGLVQESFWKREVQLPHFNTSSPGEIESVVTKFVKELQAPPDRSFYLSDLGRDFLKFVGEGHKEKQDGQSQSSQNARNSHQSNEGH